MTNVSLGFLNDLTQVDRSDAKGQIVQVDEIEMNGIKYKLEVFGDIEVQRGPLGRFIDLAEQLKAEGLTVPPEILTVLDELQQPQENCS